MKLKKFSLNRFILENAVPIFLLTALFSSVIYIYSLSDVFVFIEMTLVGFIYSLLLFLLLDFLQKTGKTLLTTIVLFIVSVLSFSFGGSLFETGYSDTARWFFEPDAFSRIFIGNITAIIVMVGFVIGSAMYYFTRVRFRAVFVFLICMCPFSLYAKSFTDIPVIFTIIIITLFFLLVISRNYTGVDFNGVNKFYAIAAFIIVVTAGAAFMPKLEFAPYREEFDELITGINIAGGAATDFNSFTDSSSSSRSDDDDDEVLYTIFGDNPIYIKRQCFNAYNSEKDLWEYYGDVSTGYNYYSDYISWENPALLAAECGIKMETEGKFSIISSANGSIHALYTPENIDSIDFTVSSLSDYGLKFIYRTPLDEYFQSKEYSYDSYALNWWNFDVDVEFMLLYDDEKAEDVDKYYSRLYMKSKEEMKGYYDPLMTETIRRDCYGSEESYIMVKTLVEDITTGCTNDYEKADAIEQYFKSDEFVYDKEFVTTDGSVENFIFNTKRGVCSNYATAMALMCREADLYSRYVEGFLVQKLDDDGNYYVTAADSHAYVQVWLNGYGWTDFDPTSTNIDNGGYYDSTFLIVGVLMLLAVFGGVIVFFVRPIINERKFIRKASLLKGREQLMLIYPRINSLAHKELGIKMNVLTVSELKKAVFDYFGADISETADDFESSFYGNIHCGNKDYMASYINLKKAIKAKKAFDKKKKR